MENKKIGCVNHDCGNCADALKRWGARDWQGLKESDFVGLSKRDRLIAEVVEEMLRERNC